MHEDETETPDSHRSTPTRPNPDRLLALKSIKWKITAGWVCVAVLAFRYLVRPATDLWLIAHGQEPLPPLEPLNLADTAALIGLPVGGSIADRMDGSV